MTETFVKSVAVCPTRLAYGAWSHRANRTVGQGDISAAYSADRIGLGEAVRSPFRYEGALWVTVDTSGDGCRAYRLIAPEVFADTTMTYREGCADGDAARSDPNGFYHGMRVWHVGNDRVLCGPPVLFVPGEIEQPSLF